MLDARSVLNVVAALEGAGVCVWLDGGWGVDALAREQSREDDDLDCVIALSDAPIARDALADLGFAVSVDELPTGTWFETQVTDVSTFTLSRSTPRARPRSNCRTARRRPI